MRKLSSCISAVRVMIRPFLGRISLTVFLGIFRIVLSLLSVWICKGLIDIVTGVSDNPLYFYVSLMIAVALCRIVVASAASYVESLNSLEATNKLRYEIFSHTLGSKWQGREKFLSGDVVNRLEEDVRVLVDIMVSKLPELLITIFQLIAAAVYLTTLSPVLMLVLVLLMFLAVVCSKMFFLKIRRLSSDIRRLDASIQQHIQENIQNRLLVLTLFGISRVLSATKSLQDAFIGKGKERLNLNTVASVCLRAGFIGGYTAAFLWGVFGIRDGVVTYGMMTAFLQLVSQIQMPIYDLGRQIPSFIHSISSVERIMELEELPAENKGEDILFSSAPGIQVKNVTFSYSNDSRKIFTDFSFEFPAGGLTVISGHTGAGKSTLIKMLLALLDPSAGTIMINDVPASADTRCNFMYVPQGNTLMSGTIRENLLMANSEATETDMFASLEAAAADFVKRLPDGLETRCSEDGEGLSEGQAQRIAIARALLHRGNVLILDESTSSLDSETEARLLSNLYGAYHQKKTIIFISHRESVFKYADARLHLD